MESTKEKLYRKVQKTREHLGITGLDYPLPYLPDLIAQMTEIYIRETPLATPGLRGMTVSVPETGTLAMLLDLNSSKEVRQFAAAHELIHCEHHPITNGASFQSYDAVAYRQNRFLEWEANEGAAELLMPYQIFIPFFFDCAEYRGGMIRQTVNDLAKHFSVSEAAIDHRISSLKWEMLQYASGAPVQRVQLLSKSQQLKRGIDLSRDTIDEIYVLWKAVGRYIT